MEEAGLLIALIQYSITGVAPADSLLQELTEERLKQVFDLAKLHDVTPLVAYALHKLGALTPGMEAKCQQVMFAAAMRYEQMNYALQQTMALLEQSKVDFIPLKGAVLRPLYPEPWMRTSCDIDILVRDVDRAEKILTESGYTNLGRGSHDVQFKTPDGMLLELHFELIETRKQISTVLEKVWEQAAPKAPGSSHYVIDDAMQYFYHTAHMAKHFGFGGIGIRFFVDTWLLCNKVTYDPDARAALLRQGGLYAFGCQAERLSRVWLENAPADSLLNEMANFALAGGTLGSNDNQVKVHKSKTSGKAGFLLYRIFMPYDAMRLKYPVLKKWPVLLPVYWVIRWGQVLTGSKLRNAMREVQMNETLDNTTVQGIRWMMQELELS